jgi:hypothetical protein
MDRWRARLSTVQCDGEALLVHEVDRLTQARSATAGLAWALDVAAALAAASPPLFDVLVELEVGRVSHCPCLTVAGDGDSSRPVPVSRCLQARGRDFTAVDGTTPNPYADAAMRALAACMKVAKQWKQRAQDLLDRCAAASSQCTSALAAAAACWKSGDGDVNDRVARASDVVAGAVPLADVEQLLLGADGCRVAVPQVQRVRQLRDDVVAWRGRAAELLDADATPDVVARVARAAAEGAQLGVATVESPLLMLRHACFTWQAWAEQLQSQAAASHRAMSAVALPSTDGERQLALLAGQCLLRGSHLWGVIGCVEAVPESAPAAGYLDPSLAAVTAAARGAWTALRAAAAQLSADVCAADMHRSTFDEAAVVVVLDACQHAGVLDASSAAIQQLQAAVSASTAWAGVSRALLARSLELAVPLDAVWLPSPADAQLAILYSVSTMSAQSALAATAALASLQGELAEHLRRGGELRAVPARVLHTVVGVQDIVGWALGALSSLWRGGGGGVVASVAAESSDTTAMAVDPASVPLPMAESQLKSLHESARRVLDVLAPQCVEHPPPPLLCEMATRVVGWHAALQAYDADVQRMCSAGAGSTACPDVVQATAVLERPIALIVRASSSAVLQVRGSTGLPSSPFRALWFPR